MGRVSRAQAEQNRQQIVAAASRLFREQGVDNVSVADLMNAVGLTHGGFYKQFASKEALQTEALAHGFSAGEADFAALDTRYADHAAAREAFLDQYLSADHRDAPGTGCVTAGFAADVARLGPGPLRDRYATGVRHYARWLSEEGAAEGTGGGAAGGETSGAGSEAGAGVPSGAQAEAGVGVLSGAGPEAGAGVPSGAQAEAGVGVPSGAGAGSPSGAGAVPGGGEDPAALATVCTIVGALLLARATVGDPVSGELLAAAREACRAPEQGGAA